MVMYQQSSRAMQRCLSCFLKSRVHDPTKFDFVEELKQSTRKVLESYHDGSLERYGNVRRQAVLSHKEELETHLRNWYVSDHDYEPYAVKRRLWNFYQEEIERIIAEESGASAQEIRFPFDRLISGVIQANSSQETSPHRLYFYSERPFGDLKIELKDDYGRKYVYASTHFTANIASYGVEEKYPPVPMYKNIFSFGEEHYLSMRVDDTPFGLILGNTLWRVIEHPETDSRENVRCLYHTPALTRDYLGYLHNSCRQCGERVYCSTHKRGKLVQVIHQLLR